MFVDLGHGIGNTVLQAALTVGCDARGIEIVPERCRVAEQFHKLIFEYIEETDYMSWVRKNFVTYFLSEILFVFKKIFLIENFFNFYYL